jgi:hypothetical protein
MHRLLWLFIVIVPVRAQNVEDATELLQKARAFGESIRSWRAEVIETSKVSGSGMNLEGEIRTKIAVQPPLRMIRQNSGGDRTISVCDGTQKFYSGDGHSYYKSDATVTGCDLPLQKFYESYENPNSALVIGEDHVRLADGDHRCVLVRTIWKKETVSKVRTMCIDPSRPLIMRDVIEAENESMGIKSITITTFVDFESDPTFSPETFRFLVLPGAVEAKAP